MCTRPAATASCARPCYASVPGDRHHRQNRAGSRSTRCQRLYRRTGSRVTATPSRALSRTRLTVPAKIGRSGIVRRHHAVTDARRAVPVAQRQIVGAGGGDLGIADQPRRAQRWHAICLVMPVRQRDMPARRTRPWRAQRHHVVVVVMRMAPDLPAHAPERPPPDLVRQADHMHIWQRRDPAPAIHRIRRQRIVVAGQDHHRPAGIRKKLRRALPGSRRSGDCCRTCRRPAAPGRLHGARGIQHPAQPRGAVVAVARFGGRRRPHANRNCAPARYRASGRSQYCLPG